MRSRRLLLFLFGCLIFWGAGAALQPQAAAATSETAARKGIAAIAAQGPMAANAIEASGAAQPGDQLKPADKLCDVPCWDAISASPRRGYSPAASSVAATNGAAAPSLVGVVVLLI